MRKLLWKRRIATLLIMCMVATQMVVPVSAQGSNPSKDVETLEIPKEYQTLKLGGDEEIVDLSEAAEDISEEAADEDAISKSLETYGSIPVIGEPLPEKEKPESEGLVEETVTKADSLTLEEEFVLETAAVTAGTVALNQPQGVYVTVPNEATTYEFTPEKSGEYVISLWQNGENIGAQMNVVQASMDTTLNYWWGESANTVYLYEGEIYYLNVTADNQGWCYFSVAEPETISVNSEDSVSINSVGLIEIDSGNETKLVRLKVESDADFFVGNLGQKYTKQVNGYYQFYVGGRTICYIANKSAEVMQAKVTLQVTSIPEVVMAEDEVSAQIGIEVVDTVTNSREYYYTFTPAVSGKYVFYSDSDNSASWNVSYRDEFNNIYYTSGSNNGVYLTDLSAGQKYEVQMWDVSGGNACVEKMDKQLLTVGEEASNTFATSFAYYEVSGWEETGIYEMTISGDQDEWKFGSSNCTTTDYSVYAKNNGVKTFYSQGNGNDLLIFSKNRGTALGELTISLKKKNAQLAFNSANHAKTSVDMVYYDEAWLSFTPEKSGEYVICTEEKDSYYINATVLKETEDGYLNQVDYDYTEDNINLHINLEAGETYYYRAYIADSNYTTLDTMNVVIYPISDSVSYSGSDPVESDIYKAVTYELSVPKAGFYQILVNGADESYFIDIEDGEGNSYLENSFVYKNIPRVFQFKKSGVYKIRVTKEIMSDSADKITFSCTQDAALQVLNANEQATVEVDNTDGVWVEYTPKESGWYSFDINQKRKKFRVKLSIESEDGTEIVYETETDYYEISGVTSYFYYLVAGRKCYYKIYPTKGVTGTVEVKVNSVSGTINADDTGLPEITSPGELCVLKTDFAEKQYTKVATESRFYIKDITEGTNEGFRSISNGNIMLFPTGEREYLLFFPKGEEAEKVEFNAWEPQEILTNEVTVENTDFYSTNWVKFVPEESGLYSLIQKSKTPNVSEFESYVELYAEGEKNVRYVEPVFEGTAFLTAGQTYYYQINFDYYGDETDKISAEYVLEKPKLQSEAFGMGDNVISMKNVWFAQAEVSEGKYISLIPENEDENYHFYWITYDEEENEYSCIRGGKVNGTENDLKFGNTANLYVMIVKGTYSTEAEDTTFTLKETEIISRELTNGGVINEPASSAIKQYTFTPNSNRHLFAIDNAEIDNIVSEDEDSTWGRWDDICGNRIYEVNPIDGEEYIIIIKNQSEYTLREIEPQILMAYDYDEYEAYIASGGTINIVDSLTAEMRDKRENGYASCDYGDISGQLVFKDSSGFKNQNDIWWPESVYSATGFEDAGERTYCDITESIEDYWGYGRYLTRDMYSIGTSSSTTPKKVQQTDMTPGGEILLHLREPAIVLIQQITLNGLTAMEVGQTSKLSVTTSTLNKYKPTNPGVVFTSSNPNVVSVDASGNMTAKSAGKAVITCTSVDGNAKQSITVTVKQSIITALTVTITGAEDTLYVGDEMSLDATIGTGGKGKPTVDGVNWSSSDTSVATVDKDGTVLGKKEGTVVITATSKDGYAKNSVTIKVKPVLAKKITLSESKIRMKKGSSYKWLEVEISPKNTTDKSVTWKSSNKKVATVSSKGVIKAKAVGTAVITATTENGKKDTVKVTVTASNIKVQKIVLDKKMTVLAGDVIKLKPEVDPVNATNKKLAYKSSNTDVVAVTAAGVATAKKPGKATITVTAKDGSGKKATCTITVKAPDEPKKLKVKSNQKKTATLSWEMVDEADGYIIYMSTSKKGKYKVAATIKGAKTNQYTVKKLKSKKKYYFKVVSYVNVGKKKVYSDETKVVNVKIK